MKVVAYTKDGKSHSLAGVAGIGGAGVALNCYKSGGVNHAKDADVVYCDAGEDVMDVIHDIYSCPVVSTLADLAAAITPAPPKKKSKFKL